MTNHGRKDDLFLRVFLPEFHLETHERRPSNANDTLMKPGFFKGADLDFKMPVLVLKKSCLYLRSLENGKNLAAASKMFIHELVVFNCHEKLL